MPVLNLHMLKICQCCYVNCLSSETSETSETAITLTKLRWNLIAGAMHDGGLEGSYVRSNGGWILRGRLTLRGRDTVEGLPCPVPSRWCSTCPGGK